MAGSHKIAREKYHLLLCLKLIMDCFAPLYHTNLHCLSVLGADTPKKMFHFNLLSTLGNRSLAKTKFSK